jgi:hypothetical protein
MSYSKFTLSRAVEDFGLTVQEEPNLFAAIPPVVPTPLLRDILVENVPWAVAVGSEKARSEGIINPVLSGNWVKTSPFTGTFKAQTQLSSMRCD